MKNIVSNIISVGIYHSDIAQKGVSVSKKRKISTFEVDIPFEHGGISHIDEKSAKIAPDLIIFAKPNQTRNTHFPLNCYYVHLTVEDEELSRTLSALPDFFHTSRREEYFDVIQRLKHRFERESYEDTLEAQSLVLRLFYMLLRDAKANGKKEEKSDTQKAINDAILYIKENLSSELSLDVISSKFGFSPTYFHKIFKEYANKTLHSYIEDERIKKAADIITTSRKTLTEVAYECGFSSQSYFSYAFKRRMKVTPREYAKRVLNNYEK